MMNYQNYQNYINNFVCQAVMRCAVRLRMQPWIYMPFINLLGVCRNSLIWCGSVFMHEESNAHNRWMWMRACRDKSIKCFTQIHHQFSITQNETKANTNCIWIEGEIMKSACSANSFESFTCRILKHIVFPIDIRFSMTNATSFRCKFNCMSFKSIRNFSFWTHLTKNELSEMVFAYIFQRSHLHYSKLPYWGSICGATNLITFFAVVKFTEIDVFDVF